MSENQKGCSPSDCQGCAHAGTCNSKPQDFHKPANAKSHIRNVIAVVSGKAESEIDGNMHHWQE